jgi:hypothetical protein
MSVNKIELENLKRDLKAIIDAGVSPSRTSEALRLIEQRRITSSLEYLGSIMEHAPWNIKS